MDLQRSAEIQALLEGVSLPATRDELIAYASREDPAAASELERIPDREYERLDDVGEALVRTQPPQQEAERMPRAESGEPPGGDDYTALETESGAVRPDRPPAYSEQDVLEAQTQAQKRQQGS